MTSIPGYDCDITENGVEHSIQKLEKAADDLRASCSPRLFADHNSRNVIRTMPCQYQEETLGYRCSCSFQIISVDSNSNNQSLLKYAMRHNNEPIVLDSVPYFPIALPKIQKLMDAFLHQVLNYKSTSDENNSSDFEYKSIRDSLSSVSFYSSWDGETDSFLSLNYSTPLNGMKATAWIKEATHICKIVLAPLKLSGVIGRSKKKKLFVAARQDCSTDSQITLHDTIHPHYPLNKTESKVLKIQYQKPLDAFHHPNGKVMIKALDWIISKILDIAASVVKYPSLSRESKSSQSEPLRLLELYCGCGAHTIPIAKLDVLDHIVAVEMDDRLVKACQDNWDLNSVKCKNDDGDSNDKDTKTLLHVVKGDAGHITRLMMHKKRTKEERRKKPNQIQPKEHQIQQTFTTSQVTKSWYTLQFDILLVDPPRQGLDLSVCKFAVQNCKITHIIYISCGREALKRDLNILGEAFEVMDCCLVDLFPRTLSSVESLVHLRRK